MTSSLRDSAVVLSTDLATPPAHAAPDRSIIFTRIAKGCVRAIRANRQRATAGNPDAVHAMRIELTKLRAAALFFQPGIPSEWQLLKKELDWLNSALGKARNLDVTVEFAERKRYRPWAAQSRRELLRSQDKVHRRLAKELRSTRYSRLISELDRWLERSAPPGNCKASRHDGVSDYCEQRLRRWRDDLSRQGRRIGELGRKELHQLRIQSKNYRYVVKSLLNLNISIPREDFAFCDVAERLHQALGDLRDLRRLRKSIGSRPPHYRRRRCKLKRRVARAFRQSRME